MKSAPLDLNVKIISFSANYYKHTDEEIDDSRIIHLDISYNNTVVQHLTLLILFQSKHRQQTHFRKK